MPETLKEQLARLEHEQWVCWMEYMFKNLNKECIARWRRKMATPYHELTEEEKESDREWAGKALNIINEYFRM